MKTLSDRIKFLPIEQGRIESSTLDLSHIGTQIIEGKVIEVGPEIEEVSIGDIIRFKEKIPVYLEEKGIKVGYIMESDVLLIMGNEKEG
jgi:hypothetical protein